MQETVRRAVRLAIGVVTTDPEPAIGDAIELPLACPEAAATARRGVRHY